MLGGVLGLLLRHLLGALGAILRHSWLLLVHALGVRRAVAHGVAGRFLAAAHQPVPESHVLLLGREQGVSKIGRENATDGYRPLATLATIHRPWRRNRALLRRRGLSRPRSDATASRSGSRRSGPGSSVPGCCTDSRPSARSRSWSSCSSSSSAGDRPPRRSPDPLRRSTTRGCLESRRGLRRGHPNTGRSRTGSRP